MKNIHSLPTDKPSRLVWYTTGKYHLLEEPIFIDAPLKPSRHIYITSDEEIKKGDWVLWLSQNKIIKCEDSSLRDRQDMVKKIILTTDKDLIKDGVQEIDDDFLEWFVENPNRNFVRSLKVPYFDESSHSYVLIIPTEEDFELVSIGEKTIKLAIPMMQDKEEIKQETIEDAAKDFIENTMKFSFISNDTKTQANRMLKCVEFGAKWQQEQDKKLYKEEEVLKIIDLLFHRYASSFRIDAKEYFLQFKKK